MLKEYYAHSKDKNKKDWQKLKVHLENVASMAYSFSIEEFKDIMYIAGLFHDIGKYQDSFQKRLEGKKISVEHSICGAKELINSDKVLFNGKFNPIGCLLAYIIAGHHSGLCNYGADADGEEMSTLIGRIKRDTENYSNYIFDVKLPSDYLDEFKRFLLFFCEKDNILLQDKYEFAVRYAYSCLTDADYLDTESFITGTKREKIDCDWDFYSDILSNYINSLKSVTKLQKTRNILQSQAESNAKSCGSISLLNMPTGSGKTLCSLYIAIEKAKKGKKRIIYVIPYTSIVEQTATEFEKILKGVKILQHHSDFDFEEKEEFEINSLKQATENWDVPFIITTNVQFFESIYSNKSSRLRKLHNMADSIIVFDEMHTLPIKYFGPCLIAVEQLIKYYGSEAIFLTATMPDFGFLTEKYIGRKLPVVDLLPDKSLFPVFDKCIYKYIGKKNELDFSAESNKSILYIFNSKKQTLKFYNACNDKEKYYLSTNLTPFDRSEKLQEIREKLKAGDDVKVFSTSLIEAGVDVDFREVYRELAGIDNILQAGGRCNREGLFKKEESIVYIFETGNVGKGDLSIKSEITRGLIKEYGERINSDECVKKYFNLIYDVKNWTMIGQKRQPMTYFYHIDFAEKANEFNFIESKSILIVIPQDEIESEINKLKVTGFADRRKLKKYSADINIWEYKKLQEKGVITVYNEISVLTDKSFYSSETGIAVLGETDYIY